MQEASQLQAQQINQGSQYYSLLHPKKDFYCHENNKARLFCCDPKCKQKIIICYDPQCQYCQQKHQKCKSYKINTLIREVLNKRQKSNPQIQKSIKTLERIFDQAIQRLSDDKMYFIDQVQLLGFNQKQLIFLQNLQNGQLNKMTGKSIKQLIDGLNSYQKWKLTQQKVQKFWKGKKNAFQSIFNTLKKLWSDKKQKMNSVICKDYSQFQYLEGLWGKRQIQEFRLVYRASDNGFSTQAFHKLCDKKKSLLVLAKTEFGKNIGGFNSFDWDLLREDRKPQKPQKGGGNQNLQAFVFSLSNQQKFFIGNKQHAIVNKGVHYGPTFGNKDFWISQRANSKQNQSYFDLGNSFAFSHKYKTKEEAIMAFTGSSQATGKNVKLVEWQVFELIGPSKAEIAQSS